MGEYLMDLRDDEVSLKVDLTTEELAEAARELGALAERIRAEEDAGKVTREAAKARLTALQDERDILSRQCRVGKVDRVVKVNVKLNRATGRLWYMEHMTGALHEGPLASRDELQAVLPFPKAADEACDEG
jgi:hypothetical protein